MLEFIDLTGRSEQLGIARIGATSGAWHGQIALREVRGSDTPFSEHPSRITLAQNVKLRVFNIQPCHSKEGQLRNRNTKSSTSPGPAPLGSGTQCSNHLLDPSLEL